MALRAIVKSEAVKGKAKSSVAALYRSMIREIPRVLVIYDIDMPYKTAVSAVAWHFRKNSHLKDARVIGVLLARGYMELEETLMQWKQKTHLLRVLEDPEMLPSNVSSMSERQKFVLGIDDY